MLIATWNLNNRVGKVPFRPEAAEAAIALAADLIVFTEFYPQKHEEEFRSSLSVAGWEHQSMSVRSPEVANRILIVSRFPIEPYDLPLPGFDQQFPSNILAVTVLSSGLIVVGVRVPAYSGKTAPLLPQAWQWLEDTALTLKDKPAVILGDLNVGIDRKNASGDVFRRILANGWTRAISPDGGTYFGLDGKTAEIDHILATGHCELKDARVIRDHRHFILAGAPNSISDHAAITCEISGCP